VEEVRIGALNGSPTETFGRLGGVAVGPGGEMAVVDLQGPVIRLFDEDGRYVRNVGALGGGPGEYRQVAGITTTPEGRFAIWDPGNGRISLFETSGELARTFPVRGGMMGGRETFHVDTAGAFYVQVIRSSSQGRIQSYAWLRLDPYGVVLDSLPIPRADEEGPVLYVLRLGASLHPFTTETVSTLSPRGYQVVGRNDTYALHRPLRDGRVLRIERSVDPVPVEPEERRQWTAFLEDFTVRAHRAEPFPPVPTEKPVFRALQVDEDGRIWVDRYVPAVYTPLSDEEREARGDSPVLEWKEPSVWDVVGAQGTFYGTVELPRGGSPAWARGRRVWVIEYGEYDEGYLVRYRIEPDP
jgi:hypothetical protein